ncbi:hypothetical protein IAR55_000597 [Kwoniella newhampshirensis]|uniref:Endoplasmic reticulum junction formation protein lunapark n=1 Tax=Kwoniella newhampshirensis TaxID=1651941 RepID=A0AAW0Z720_9TREE
MGLFSIFSKSAPPDYETLLARLATDISEAKTHLSEIRLRERRFSLLVNAYGVAAWAVWVGLWWVNGLPLGLIGLSHRDIEGRVISLGGIMGGPVFIYLLNRLVHIYFKRQRTHEETHLRALLTQQRKHLEEIKKATNYDSTRKLIEQYDDPSAGTRSAPGPNQAGGIHPSPRTPQRKVLDSPSPAGTKSAGPGGTPRAPGHLIGAGGTPGPANSPIPIPEGLSSDQAAALQMQIHAIQPVLPTPEKRWYDRVVDFILGDDPSQAAQSKYALVCGECFRHNGLVGSKYEWERMQWICPRCNHLNPSPLSKLQNTSSTQPLPSSPAPAPTVTSAPSPSIVKRAPASPRPRRQIGGGGNGTPRSSRLSKEVFSASSEDDDDEEEDADADELDRGDNMDVDMEGK